MSKLFYYRHKIGDYDTATKDLSMLEHGCYRRLMDGYYANKGPISSAFPTLCRIAGAFMPDEQAAVRKIAGMYFDAESQPGFLVHRVCDEEIVRVISESERQSAAAKSRWAKEADLASPDATAHATAHAVVVAEAHAGAHAAGMPVKIQDSKKALPPISPNLLPDWLPKLEWDAFLAMRKRKRASPTDRAIVLLLNKLEALKVDGHDPGRVLDQSTENNWTGLFPLKRHGQAVTGRRAATEANNDQTADSWADSTEDDKEPA